MLWTAVLTVFSPRLVCCCVESRNSVYRERCVHLDLPNSISETIVLLSSALRSCLPRPPCVLPPPRASAMDVLGGLKGVMESPTAFLMKHAFTVLGFGSLGVVLIVALQALAFAFLGDLECHGGPSFTPAATQRCLELDLLFVSGCGSIRQLQNNVTDPSYPIGRGSNIYNDVGTHSMIQVLNVTMWYLVDVFEGANLDCSAFRAKPMSRTRDLAIFLAAMLPTSFVAILLAVYTSRLPLLRSLASIQRIVATESLEYQDYIMEAEEEIVGGRSGRHRTFAMIYVLTPLLQIGGMVGNLFVMNMAFQGLDFLMWVPRTVTFSGLLTGTPLMPLNGWRRKELFRASGSDLSYGHSVRTDYMFSKDSVYQPPTFESGLAGTDSKWLYLQAMFSHENMPTPLNNLLPGLLSCDLARVGPSGTSETNSALCTIRGNQGFKSYIFAHHILYLLFALAYFLHFLWRLSFLLPCVRRRSLRMQVPVKATVAADLLSGRLGFPNWLLLRIYLK